MSAFRSKADINCGKWANVIKLTANDPKRTSAVNEVMHQKPKQKQDGKQSIQSNKTATGKVCLACKYVRKETDIAPNWQCPNCEAAYTKLEADNYYKGWDKEDLQKRNDEYRMKKKMEKESRAKELLYKSVLFVSTTATAALGGAHLFGLGFPTIPGLVSLIVAALFMAISYFKLKQSVTKRGERIKDHVDDLFSGGGGF